MKTLQHRPCDKQQVNYDREIINLTWFDTKPALAMTLSRLHYLVPVIMNLFKPRDPPPHRHPKIPSHPTDISLNESLVSESIIQNTTLEITMAANLTFATILTLPTISTSIYRNIHPVYVAISIVLSVLFVLVVRDEISDTQNEYRHRQKVGGEEIEWDEALMAEICPRV